MSDINHKPEKLASAIYLVTSFFGEQEPMKWKLRNLASNLVSCGVGLADTSMGERERFAQEMRRVVLESGTLLSVARNTGLLSPMNYDLIHKELFKYLELLGLPEGMSEREGGLILEERFFSSSEIRSNPNTLGEVYKSLPKAPLADNTSTTNNIRTTEDGPLRRDSQTNPSTTILNDNDIESAKNRMANRSQKDKYTKSKKLVSVKKSNRRNTILELIKRKKEIMITDVSPHISGCSDKTIQRELSSMVKEGVLKKEGEKRWTRYSLA